jgi:putative membrane protein
MSTTRGMNHGIRSLATGLLLAAAGVAAPAWAVSLAATQPAQPLPSDTVMPASLAADAAAGSATLVPVVAADMEARQVAPADVPAVSGAPAGKPVDDIQFVRQASESGRKEIAAARDALPQLKNPELKRIAQMLVADHGGAAEKLARIAEAKGWPLPAPAVVPPPASGTASGDFDSKWAAEMIAGHERSIALYRAQASGGEDKDLRDYARDTLPTIESHLAQLRSVQK